MQFRPDSQFPVQVRPSTYGYFQDGGQQMPQQAQSQGPSAQEIAQQFLQAFQQLPPEAQQLIIQALTQR